ncbi:MAG: methionine--tRNA ligase [Candidatus Sungbacteria bacterium RIFCSPLOWO2_12_FULL_41_11]|uniref:Methionine--tRNA ligase n=1 Tax=Candidatus Sungbacteria bacterium RIFCSPLOWO2_12_FULL_41_11 TaxID=1802286 RepID=A0A1G2LPI8_9BACT|nr:MAG: Methionine-tRNA ligase [Parcubacteria group bacterium GW2011_GWA2_42_14]OGZ97844.1 MAG: methionine--tRNA ligase [Candidatus Sungbacteria bacterium RIFCSPHIGHO2_02_FULL_41_12b]OHA13483.1 MAG: methionine--tRNA ligase [Candidatus Sungbacteria bacterium RIFCSPLOWO2_12_FULL_41_11]
MSSKYYITTAIDYVNAKPHIGHALEKIQADVLARFHRIKGDDVWFLTGTDEHGAKIARAAEAAGKNPKDFVDENSEKFRELKIKNVLNLSWNDFIRTSDQKRHWPGAQKLWLKLFEAGDLYKKKYRGLYCVGHEAFVTEKDLVQGKCRDHQKEPEVIEEENYFFRLSKYSKEVELRIRNNELRIIPESRKNEILSLIESGLEDVSFSRPRKDLSWGIPVPNDPEHTMYVWCDALANYITAIGYGQEKNYELGIRNYGFEQLWPADLHVIGKDILRFHAAIWPGMLLSAGLSLSKAIFVHGFVTVEGQKMSKTIGNVIDPIELVKKYETDSVRYFLLREIPSGEDGDFSYKKFEDRYNGDLANGLGNLVARVATLGEKISPINFDFQKDVESGVKEIAEKTFKKYEACFEEIRLNEALASIWELVSFADKYINDKKPWGISDKKELRGIIINVSYIIGAIVNLLAPFLPETVEKIKKQILVDDSILKIKKGGNLFPRLK